jgi:bilirubin oxidase
MYLLEDPAEAALGLPSGYGTFDIPLVLSSKQYNNDGSLTTTEGEDDSFWGDIIEVVRLGYTMREREREREKVHD